MKPRGLIIALLISVALNLFLAGLIVGGAVVARRVAALAPAVAPQGRLPLWRAGDDLPVLKRRAFRQMFRKAAVDSQDDIRQSRRIRREAIAALESPDFDAEAVIARLDQARETDSKARGGVEAEIMRFAATLTPAERTVLAEGLRRAMANQLRDPPPRGQARRDRPAPPPEE
ncbi:MAG: periplasmic heavy metal sensor [Caulobacter sp.]|nr:periplasmic heavy metal sensor [Caulobacter sp.]